MLMGFFVRRDVGKCRGWHARPGSIEFVGVLHEGMRAATIPSAPQNFGQRTESCSALWLALARLEQHSLGGVGMPLPQKGSPQLDFLCNVGSASDQRNHSTRSTVDSRPGTAGRENLGQIQQPIGASGKGISSSDIVIVEKRPLAEKYTRQSEVDPTVIRGVGQSTWRTLG